jgi:hypothetical protein
MPLRLVYENAVEEIVPQIIHVLMFFKEEKRKQFAFDLVVRVPGYRPRGLGSIPCATRFSEK